MMEIARSTCPNELVWRELSPVEWRFLVRQKVDVALENAIFCSPPSHLVLSSPLLLLLLHSRNSDPGLHSRLFSALPTAVRSLRFCCVKGSVFASLVDSRRIVPTRAIVGALDSCCHVENNKRKSPYGESKP